MAGAEKGGKSRGLAVGGGAAVGGGLKWMMEKISLDLLTVDPSLRSEKGTGAPRRQILQKGRGGRKRLKHRRRPRHPPFPFPPPQLMR